MSRHIAMAQVSSAAFSRRCAKTRLLQTSSRRPRRASAFDRLTDAHKMLKSLLVVALVAGCSASQLNQPRPAIAARSQESLALRLRGGNSVVTVAPQTNVLRGGGSKPLFMGIDVQLLSYFAFWSVPIPEAARTYPLPTPQPGYITTLGATQVPAQLLLLD